MSLYNQLLGFNDFAGAVLVELDIDSTPAALDAMRFRDAYITDDLRYAIFARIGGGNRPDYAIEIAKLRMHPQYLSDEDDSFDATFAHFYFSVPEEYLDSVRTLLAAQGHFDPMERFQAMVAELGAGRGSERARAATDAISKQLTAVITDAVQSAEETGEGKVIVMADTDNGGIIRVAGTLDELVDGKLDEHLKPE